MSKNKDKQQDNDSAPLHPGKVLKGLLAETKMEKLEVAAYWLAISEVELSCLIDEDIPLSADMALRLSRFFNGRTAYDWMKLQMDFDLHEAECRLKIFFIYYGGARNLNYLHSKEDLTANSNLKKTKETRSFLINHLITSIEDHVNSDRAEKGMSLWSDRDFENAFSIGSQDNPGRQWSRWRNGEGVSTDQLHLIKETAEKKGWYEDTKLSHTDLLPGFLSSCEAYFLRRAKHKMIMDLKNMEDMIT